MACTKDAACSGQCWSSCNRVNCGSGCASLCIQTCSGSCSGCSGCSGCGSGCASSCSGCRGSCSGSCTSCSSCSGTCKGGCQGTCNTACKGTCKTYCDDACTASSKLDIINNLASTIDLTIGGKITIAGLNQLKDYAVAEVNRRGQTPTGALAGSVGTSVTAADANSIFEDIKTLGQTYSVNIGDVVVTDSFDESIAYLQGLMKQNIKG